MAGVFYYTDFAWKRTAFDNFDTCLCPVRSYSKVVAAALSCSGVCPGQLLEWSHRDVRAVPHWKLHQHWQTDSMYAMWGRANHTTAWSNTVLWWVWPFTQRNACGEKKEKNLHTVWKIQTHKRLKKRMLFIRVKHNMLIFWVIPSYKTTLKQQLSGEKWVAELGHLSAFGWAVLFSCPVFGRMFAWQWCTCMEVVVLGSLRYLLVWGI